MNHTYPTDAHVLVGKLLLAKSYILCNTTKRKKLLHLRIYNENLHKIPHISQKYVLNCLSKPFCLLSSSEEGSGASTPPESNGSENSTTKQIKGPVLFQKPFYTCFINTLRKSRAFYFHRLLRLRNYVLLTKRLQKEKKKDRQHKLT